MTSRNKFLFDIYAFEPKRLSINAGANRTLFFAVNFGVGGQVLGANEPGRAQRAAVRPLARVRRPLVPRQVVLALVRQLALPALERPVARVHPEVAGQLELLETPTKPSVHLCRDNFESLNTYIRTRCIRTV